MSRIEWRVRAAAESAKVHMERLVGSPRPRRGLALGTGSLLTSIFETRMYVATAPLDGKSESPSQLCD